MNTQKLPRYAVTHVDAQHVRRRLLIGAPTRAVAQAEVEQRYGLAWCIVAVRLGGAEQ